MVIMVNSMRMMVENEEIINFIIFLIFHFLPSSSRFHSHPQITFHFSFLFVFASFSLLRLKVNTESTTLAEKSVLHYEGGWPKDVNYQDPEQTLRYRRKIEKDETYMTQVPKLGEVSEQLLDTMDELFN